MAEWQQTSERTWHRNYGDGSSGEVTVTEGGYCQYEVRFPGTKGGGSGPGGTPAAARERVDEMVEEHLAQAARWAEANRTDGMQREGGPALIIQHCAVFGRLPHPVRSFSVGHVRPHAQHPCSVDVSFYEPRKRTTGSYTMVPDDTRYLTIEVGGRVVYDSRVDVPCDRAKWEETNAKPHLRRAYPNADRWEPEWHPLIPA